MKVVIEEENGYGAKKFIRKFLNKTDLRHLWISHSLTVLICSEAM